MKMLCENAFVKQQENTIDMKYDLQECKKNLEKITIENSKMKETKNQLERDSQFFKAEYDKLNI